MRAEIESPQAEVVIPEYPPAPPVAPPRRRRFDGFELGVLAAFGAISMWVLALDLWQVVVNGRVWTGTDGVYLVDQMQYLSWIRDVSHHGLASNLFVLRATPADYFQPAILVSGGLTALGVAPWLSLLLWKPVAVIASFFAVRAFVYRSLQGLWSRRTALVLAVFFGAVTVLFGQVTVVGDMFLGFLSWGYTFALMAVAAMVAALLAYDRARTQRRIRWAPGVLGAVAGLLHPWQGELLISLIIGGELIVGWSRPFAARRLRQAAVTVALTALPLLYYVVLARVDLSWQLARDSASHSFPFGPVLLAMAPLLLPALLAYRERPRTFLAAATRFWPLAAVAVFVVSVMGLSGAPVHAFQGISIPLAVLAVQGGRRMSWRRLPHAKLVGVLAVGAITVPATVVELVTARTLAAPTVDNANFIRRDERDALDYLARDPEPGGVLTRSYLGATVPGATGRHTLIGDCQWSEPNCEYRGNATQAMFGGTLGATATRKLVLVSGARFVLSDCETSADLPGELGRIIQSVHRFGCATVYTVQ